MDSFQIEFQPLGLRNRFPSNRSILDSARQMGIDIVSLCGGVGGCGRCKVQIVSGRVSEPQENELELFTSEEILKGYRLACMTYPKTDLIVNVPAESLSAPQRLQVEGTELPVRPDPTVHSYDIKLNAPSLKDIQGDDDRLFEGLFSQHGIICDRVDIKLLESLSPTLRSFDWEASVVVRNGEIISLDKIGCPNFGLAVDLGTTKIAGYLVDLENGRTLSSKGVMNPQIAYGEDVIARISRAQMSSGDALILQNIVLEALNNLSEDLCREKGVGVKEVIKDIVIAGNTAMHHLLLRLPLDQLARAPHVPGISRAIDVKARDLGLSAAIGAYVHLPPNIAGFVGGDHVTMLLAIKAWELPGPLLAVDIGTNTEISLAIEGEISSVSCASGPAFEGAHISSGMRAGAGAIDHVRILGDRTEYHTIHGKAPVGICGSGIFDILAQMLLNRIIDSSGRITDDHPLVRINKKDREFVLVNEEESGNGKAITITQGDVRELQLAKAAIRSGIEILMTENGITYDKIIDVVVAGAFGSYLDLSSTISIGMFPPISLDRFRQVGNAAGAGAKTALISNPLREEIQRVTKRIRYIELAGAEDFNRTYMKAISFA